MAPSAPLPAIVLFPNSSGMGGMEVHVVHLARGLRARGLEVAAICEPRVDTQPFRADLRALGVTVHEPGPGATGGPIRRVRALTGVLRRYPGCVVHMHYGGYGGGELIQIAAGLARASAVVRTEHVPPVPPITARRKLQVKLRDHFLNQVICVAEQNRAAHIRQLGRDPRKLVVVHNGIDLTQFSSPVERAEFGFASGALVVGTVARLSETRKGIQHFVDMAAELSRQIPAARFVVVGDGALRGELEAQAAASGLDQRLVFTGERSDIASVLAAFDVFVMPSLYEAGPYTVLEALAARRAVVSTPVGLVPEVIEDGVSGRLVPVGDSSALAQGVAEVLADPARALRMGECGRERVLRQYGLDAMVDGIVDVYRSALAA